MVQSLLHVGHCLFIAVANALHHQPFLEVLWLGHMSSCSLNRSWLVISDWNRFCDDDAPRLRSSWMRPRVGVLRWHSNSSCSLLVFLSLVPTNFFVFCLAVLVQLDIYLSGLCSILPYVSIVFLLQHGTRESKSVSREGEVFLQKFTYHLGHGCCPVLFLPPFLYAVEYCLPTFLFVLRQRRWS